MKQYPDIQVITKVGDWDSAKGVDIVRDVASTEADLDAIYMHSDCVYGPSMVQTLEEVGKDARRGEDGHIHLAGVDGCLVTLDFIRDGIFDQSSNQPIPDFGVLAADFIEKKLKGEPSRPARSRRRARCGRRRASRKATSACSCSSPRRRSASRQRRRRAAVGQHREEDGRPTESIATPTARRRHARAPFLP